MAEIADRLSGAREVIFALRIGHVPEIAKAANGSIVSIIMSDLSDSGLNAVITE